MTITKEKKSSGHLSIIFNRIMYVGFVLLALYFFIKGNPGDSMINLGLSLIFDPFDQAVSWKDRPRYQRIWLLVHVSMVLLMVGFIIF